MEYHFNIAWFVVGFLIACAGGVFMRYHQWIADNFGGGLGSYDRYKLAALIMTVFGLLSMTNLPFFLLGLILQHLFGGLGN